MARAGVLLTWLPNVATKVAPEPMPASAEARCRTASAACSPSADYRGSTPYERLQFSHIPKTGGTAIEAAALSTGVYWGKHRRHQMRRGDFDHPADPPSYPWERNGRYCEEWHTPLGAWRASGFLGWSAPAPTCRGSDCEPPYRRDAKNVSDVFCVVRHPFARAVSQYMYEVGGSVKRSAAGCDAAEMNRYIKELVPKLPTYDGDPFPRGGWAARPHKGCHWLPQWMYTAHGPAAHEPAEVRMLPHRNRGLTCNWVLRYEDGLSSQFDELVRLLGRPPELVAIAKALTNTSEGTRPCSCGACEGLHASDLDAEARELLGRYYARDLQVFGYKEEAKTTPSTSRTTRLVARRKPGKGGVLQPQRLHERQFIGGMTPLKVPINVTRANSVYVCLAEPEIDTSVLLTKPFVYANPLWPDSLNWMRLPPGTHLLLYGSSHMAAISSALRAAAQSLDVLLTTQTLSHSNFCSDPMDLSAPDQDCSELCGEFMVCGPLETPCDVVPHSITLDVLEGGSSITTIANHAQSQRPHARLADWLALVHPSLLEPNAKWTHGAFMPPHNNAFFDAHCTKEQTNGTFVPDASLVGDEVEMCPSKSDGACPRADPGFATMSQWVERPVAALIKPNETATRAGVAPPELRCVTDEQLASAECNGVRNDTVWLAQGHAALLYPGATLALPLCNCDMHMCTSRCAVSSDGFNRCDVGPGIAAAWLVLRASGLA